MILTSKWFSSYDVFLCYEIVYFYGLYVPSCNIFLYSFSCSIPFFVIFCTRVYFLSQTQEFNYLYVKSLVFEISNHFLILLIFSFIFNFYLFIIIFRIQIRIVNYYTKTRRFGQQQPRNSSRQHFHYNCFKTMLIILKITKH